MASRMFRIASSRVRPLRPATLQRRTVRRKVAVFALFDDYLQSHGRRIELGDTTTNGSVERRMQKRCPKLASPSGAECGIVPSTTEFVLLPFAFKFLGPLLRISSVASRRRFGGPVRQDSARQAEQVARCDLGRLGNMEWNARFLCGAQEVHAIIKVVTGVLAKVFRPRRL